MMNSESVFSNAMSNPLAQKIETMDEPRHVSAHLAHNLIALRNVRTLTQEALAKSPGVPRSTIASLESGDGNRVGGGAGKSRG